MAEVLGKDPDSYDREKRDFLKSLKEYHHNRGTPFVRPPKISGREVDLYLLFNLVSSRGGFEKVNQANEWPKYLPHFLGWRECANGVVGLKLVYLRYLDRYEKSLRGVEVDENEDHSEEPSLGGSRRARGGGGGLNVFQVPFKYNHQQHAVSDTTRQQYELAPVSSGPSVYEKILLSLSSCLPNEQEFALNILTLLCSENSKEPLKFAKCPAIIDYLCFHAGVFRDESMKKLNEDYTKNHDLPDLASYWKEAIPNAGVREALLQTPPDVHAVESLQKVQEQPASKDQPVAEEQQLPVAEETQEKQPEPSLPEVTEDKSMDFSDCDSGHAEEEEDMEQEEEEVEEEEEVVEDCLTDARVWGEAHCHELAEEDDLFAPSRGLGAHDKRGLKAHRIALIFHNASFDEENLKVLAENQACLRFLLVCIHAAAGGGQGVQLAHTAWGTLANLGHEVRLLDPDADRTSAQLLKTIISSIVESPDRGHVMGALETLQKMASREGNEENLARFLPNRVYSRICELLTVEDIMLLLTTLETLYSLTGIGGKVCNAIADGAPGAIDLLVSLLTVEAQSYGSKACVLMRVIETTTTTTVPVTEMKDDNEQSVQQQTPGKVMQQQQQQVLMRAGSSAVANVVQSTPVRTVTAVPAMGVPKPAIRQQLVSTPMNGSSPMPTVVSTTVIRPPGPNVVPRQQVANVVTSQPRMQLQQLQQVQQQQHQQQQVQQATVSTSNVVKSNFSQFRVPQPQIVRPGVPIGIQSQQRLTVGKYDSTTGTVETSTSGNTADDHEAFAIRWISANYQTEQGSTIEQSELYKHYMVGMSQHKRERLPPATFAYCVRMVFGSQVGPFQKKLPGGAINHYHYFGISKRPVPLEISTTSTAVSTSQQQQTTAVVSTSTSSTLTAVSTNGQTPMRAPQVPSTFRPQQQLQQQLTPQAHMVVRQQAPAAARPAVTAVTVVSSTTTTMPSTTVVQQNGTAMPGSPILKAQLSTPPRPGGPANPPAGKQTHPHLSHALLSGGTVRAAPSPPPSPAPTTPPLLLPPPAPPSQQQQLIPQTVSALTASHSPPPLQMPPLTAKTPGAPPPPCRPPQDGVQQQQQQPQQLTFQQAQQQLHHQPQSSLIKSLLASKVSQNLEKKMSPALATTESLRDGDGSVLARDQCNDGDSSAPSSTTAPGLIHRATAVPNPVQQVLISGTNGKTYVIVPSSNQNSQPAAPSPSVTTTATVAGSALAPGKGLLAEMLEREVHKEAASNGTIEKEIRISDKGLELVARDDGTMVNGDVGGLKRRLSEQSSVGEPAAKRAAIEGQLDGLDREDLMEEDLEVVDAGQNYVVEHQKQHIKDKAKSFTAPQQHKQLTEEDLRIVCLDGTNDQLEEGVVILNQGQAFVPSQPQARIVTVQQQQQQQQQQRFKVELPHVCLNPETCGEPGCKEKFLDGGDGAQRQQQQQQIVVPQQQQQQQQFVVPQQQQQQFVVAQQQQQQYQQVPQPAQQQLVLVRHPNGQHVQYVAVRNTTSGQQQLMVPQQHQQQQRLVVQQQPMQQQQMFLPQGAAGQGGLRIVLLPQTGNTGGPAGQKVAFVGQQQVQQHQILQHSPQIAVHHQNQPVVSVAVSAAQMSPAVVVSGAQVVQAPQQVPMTMTRIQGPQVMATAAGPGMRAVTVATRPMGGSNMAMVQQQQQQQQQQSGQVRFVSQIPGQSQPRIVAPTAGPGLVHVQTGQPATSSASSSSSGPLSPACVMRSTGSQTNVNQQPKILTPRTLASTRPVNPATNTSSTTTTVNTQLISIPTTLPPTHVVSSQPPPLTVRAGVQQQQQQQQFQQQQQQQQQPQQQHRPVVASKSLPKDEYLCEWAGCHAAFKNPNEVYPHACAQHCGEATSTEEMICLWGKCDAMKRKRLSIMTHLLDRHCNEQMLKNALNRRKRTAMGMPVPPEPEHVAPSNHAGYAPNAAFQAIRRHAMEAMQQLHRSEDKEGPVTKSIRLTSALILKNLVTYSDGAKRLVKAYESQLTSVAASEVESSRTVAQILFDLHSSPPKARKLAA